MHDDEWESVTPQVSPSRHPLPHSQTTALLGQQGQSRHGT